MKSTIPNSFFEEEVRCEHLVTTEVKKLWSIQMSCAQELQRICEKHGIKYFAGGGTLLGAVRHKGFIPWDDDMDVFMLREDYEKLMQVAPTEIQEPFFFQCPSTQKGFTPSMCRIRRSDTTGLTQYEWDYAPLDFNSGVFLDIFPLDYVPDTKLGKFITKLQRFYYIALLTGHEEWVRQKRNGKKLPVKFVRRLCHLWWNIAKLFTNHEKVCKAFTKVCSRRKTGKEVGLLTFCGMNEKYFWKTEWFDKTVELPFENMTIHAPEKYHEILEKQFGDYMKFEKGTALHTMAVFDAETPYSERLKGHYENPSKSPSEVEKEQQ